VTRTVPTVDISTWIDGSEADRSAIAAQVDDACRTFGFLKIAGHGVSTSTIDDMRTVTDEFFALPEESKLRVATPSAEIDRGYSALGSEALSYSVGAPTPPDMFEAFNAGIRTLFGPLPDEDPRHANLWAADIWPASPQRMREVWAEYITALRALGDRMLHIFGVALDIDENFFVGRSDRSPDVIRALNYERHAGDPDPTDGQMRLGAHTDYGAVTILSADPVPGLQIMGPDDTWWDITPTDGTFLVNLGDLIAAWTNDQWRSTLHRVVPPARTTDGPSRRRSIAYFHASNTDQIVEPIPSCVDDDHPRRYPSFCVGDHLNGKVVGPRTMTASDGVSTAGDRTSVLFDGHDVDGLDPSATESVR
jgi:isopenicillin N synthase-like dioxygenase